jgi:hypothetical protein
VYHSDLSRYVFDRTVGLSVIYHGMSLTVPVMEIRSETYHDKSLIDIQYGQRHAVINHCDTPTVQSETYHDKSLIDVQVSDHTVRLSVIYHSMSLTVLYVYQ